MISTVVLLAVPYHVTYTHVGSYYMSFVTSNSLVAKKQGTFWPFVRCVDSLIFQKLSFMTLSLFKLEIRQMTDY